MLILSGIKSIGLATIEEQTDVVERCHDWMITYFGGLKKSPSQA
jgi:hypothetical protein